MLKVSANEMSRDEYKPLDHADLYALLCRRVREAGSQQRFCQIAFEKYGVKLSQTHLSEVINNAKEKNPGPKVIQALGLRAVTRFIPIDP